MRNHYTQQLDALHAELRSLGQRVIAAITWSLGAFDQHDSIIAQRVIADDLDIDDAQYTLEEHVIGVIATQQPVAGDLRRLLATIAVASEFERIGDYAKSIAKTVIANSNKTPLEPSPELGIMADKALIMLHKALEAFIVQDIEAARQLAKADDDVDELQNTIRGELLKHLQREPEQADQIVGLLALTHNLERIADRSTNIAERVIFMVSGAQEELNP